MTALSAWLRLDLRLQRFELAVVCAALGALAVALAVVAAQLNAVIDANPDCFGVTSTGGPLCRDAVDKLVAPDQVAELLLRMAWLSPALGLVLGAPIVAREIELGTAPVVWALIGNRLTWLVPRVVPVAVILTAMLLVVGALADSVAFARAGRVDPGFSWSDQRGLVLPARGVLALAIAALMGGIAGRVLPGLLASAIGFSAFLIILGVAVSAWQGTEARVAAFGDGAVRAGRLVLEAVAILPDGQVVREDVVEGRPEGAFVDGFRYIDAADADSWEFREVGLLGVAIGLTAGVLSRSVSRRRPI